MSSQGQIKKVEMYIFDNIDNREIDLQEIDGVFGQVEVKSSILEHKKVDSNRDYKQKNITQVMMKEVDEAKRFRYATENSKPDGLGIILRSSEHDFVFTSINQDLSQVYKEIKDFLD